MKLEKYIIYMNHNNGNSCQNPQKVKIIFSTTNRLFIMQHNKSLLIIGYSNSDEYINAELMRMKQYHGNKCRIVVISYMPDNVRTNWNSDPHRRKWPEENTYYMLSHLMGREVARLLASNNIPEKDVIDSEDGCVKWYLCGFQTAIKRYKKDIIKFLTSISVF